MTVGMADTREEAIAKFVNSIDGFYIDFQKDTLHGYGTKARPREALTANVSAGTMSVLNHLAKRYECSLEEAIDYLAGYMLMAGLPEEPDGKRKTPLD